MAKHSHDNKIKLSHFNSRLETFKELSKEKSIDPIELAHAGFFIRVELSNVMNAISNVWHWEDVAEPYFEHVYKTQGDCPYILHTSGGLMSDNLVLHTFQPMDITEDFKSTILSFIVGCFSNPINYMCEIFRNRLSSYFKYPSNGLSPLPLAHQGLIYKHGSNSLECHECQFKLSNPTSLQESLLLHMKEKCTYMEEVFGKDSSNLSKFLCCHICWNSKLRNQSGNP